ncbi:MAG: hypothetical protein Q9228_004534 [Teloschistes exilis]
MQLLPIIIVVSLLAFFIALTLVIFAWRAFTAAERRTKQRAARYKEGPVRQMTLRDGKIIPLPRELYLLGKKGRNSADLSTLTTGGSEKSREKPVMPRRNPFTLTPLEKHPKLFGPRDSSPPTDLEAQTHLDPKKFEENLKTLRILNNRLLQEPENRVIPRRPTTRRRWPGNQSNAINSKKITESLQKAYNVHSFPSRQMSQTSDYPLSPRSKPVPKHLRHTPQAGGLLDPSNRRVSKARSESNQPRSTRASDQLNEVGRGNGRQGSGKSFSLPSDFPIDAIQSVQTLQVPPPVAAVEVRSSKGRIDSFEGRNPISFFSTTTTKTRDSRTSSAAPSLPHSGQTSKRVSTVPSIPPLKLPSALKPPPPTPATTNSSLEKPKPIEEPEPLKPSPTTSIKSASRHETRHPRPPDIDVSAANATHRTSFLLDDGNTPTSPPAKAPEPEIQHGHDQSARSTRSFATFASSDLSSTWTFGNAKRVPIFPSVVPRPVGGGGESGFHVAPLRPKSKYGRKVKPRGMKALPVLPKSPLSEQEAAV